MNENVPDSFVCMIQKEVAERILMNREKSNILGVAIQYLYDVKRVCDVSKSCFSPPPKVESSVIKLIKKSNIPDMRDRKKYLEIVNFFFKKRRKMLSSIAKGSKFKVPFELAQKRPEDLSIDDWERITG